MRIEDAVGVVKPNDFELPSGLRYVVDWTIYDQEVKSSLKKDKLQNIVKTLKGIAL
jgi:hypothetical protein